MANPTLSQARAYALLVDGLGKTAKNAFLQEAAKVDYSSAGFIEALANIYQYVHGRYGRASREAGFQWYEWCRRLAIKGEYAAEGVAEFTAGEALSRKPFKKFANSEIDVTQLVEALATSLEGGVKGQSKSATVEAMLNDRAVLGDGTARYMRVPTGAVTCAFCQMLASRGPVYYTRQTATFADGTLKQYHSSCDCVVVPVFGDDSTIEGYDPSIYYDRYMRAREAWEKGQYSDELKERFKRENLRDANMILAVWREQAKAEGEPIK